MRWRCRQDRVNRMSCGAQRAGLIGSSPMRAGRCREGAWCSCPAAPWGYGTAPQIARMGWALRRGERRPGSRRLGGVAGGHARPPAVHCRDGEAEHWMLAPGGPCRPRCVSLCVVVKAQHTGVSAGRPGSLTATQQSHLRPAAHGVVFSGTTCHASASWWAHGCAAKPSLATSCP